MTKIILKIDRMHCPSCSMNIDFALEDLPGVRSAVTRYARSECTVEFDPDKTSVSRIIKCIDSSGYSASPVDSFRDKLK